MADMLSQKQKEFLLSPLHRINLLYGSVRSGKTWISLLRWALWIGQQPPGSQFLMVGKTITTLDRNCLRLLKDLIGDHLSYSTHAKIAYVFNRLVWLEGANDERAEKNIRGTTLKGCYIDELTQIPQGFYMMILSRLSERGACLIATTNPDAPSHYVKTEIIDNADIDAKCVKFLLDDNVFLDEEYKRNIKREYKGVYYDRFILGEFVRAEGVVFRDFADNPTAYEIEKADLPRSFQSVGVGYDLGGNKSAFALVATGVSGNRVYVLRSVEIQADELRLADVEKAGAEFIEGVERDFGCRVRSCYVDDNYYTTVNSLNDWRPIFDTASRIKSIMPLWDRPLLLSKLMAAGNFRYVRGECDPLVEQLRNAVFDDKSEKAIICDDGSMRIDEIDAFFYSIADDYQYLNGEQNV